MRLRVDAADFGAYTTNTAAQNSAAFAAGLIAHAGKEIWLEAGTYLIDALEAITVQTDGSHFSPVAACFRMASGLHLRGVKGETIIKAKDAITPMNNIWNMFMSNTYDEDISFDGIIFDLNGQNNPQASPDVSHQAALIWSGAVARPDRLSVTNCQFINSAGLTGGIATGFSITTPAPMGDGFICENNIFKNNGFGVTDHSTVFSASKNASIRNNVFSLPGVVVSYQNAVEIHGPNTVFTGNHISDYVGGVIIAGGQLGENVQSVSVYDNDIRCSYNCIWFFRNNTGANTALFDVNVHDNILEIIDTTKPAAYPAVASCISLLPNHLCYQVFIHDNVLIKGAYVNSCYGILVGNATPGEVSYDLNIKHNYINGFTRNIELPDVLGVGSVGAIYITDNVLVNAKTSTVPASSGIGAVLSARAGQTISDLYFEGNKVINSEYGGVATSGAITNLKYDFNYVQAGSNYAELLSATVTTDRSYYQQKTITTAVLASSVGTITAYTTSITYTKIGKHVTYDGLATITDNGTGSGNLFLQNLPFTSANYACGVAREAGVSGITCALQVETGVTYAQIIRYDNGAYIGATNASFRFSLSYPTTT